MAYAPDADYNEAYEAANRRLQASGARRRGLLTQEIASKGVSTSGVSAIPIEEYERGQQEAEAGLVGEFALSQADNAVQDRRLAQSREHDMNMMTTGYGLQDAISRRLGRQQLQGQVIGGVIGGAGSVIAGRR